ncbi:MAG: hypothetical protein ACTHKG_07540 [Nocardioides sp.]
MQWDLGLQGLGLLLVMAAAFGVFAQLVAGRAVSRWIGVVAAASYVVAGIFVSEVWFGWATEEELQPNIDGLSFDEVLLICTLPGIAVVLLARRWASRHHAGTRHGPRHAAT